MKARIVRMEDTEAGVLGALLLDDELFCATLEDPDLDNQVGISCIPEGVYLCKRVKSPRFGDTFEVTKVPGRTHILFHPGNTQRDTRGCVLLGQYWGKLQGDRAIMNSGDSFRGFIKATEGVSEFWLLIDDVAYDGDDYREELRRLAKSEKGA